VISGTTRPGILVMSSCIAAVLLNLRLTMLTVVPEGLNEMPGEPGESILFYIWMVLFGISTCGF